MLRIARSTIRVRWASFVGTLVALALGVGLMATAVLVIAATGNVPDRPYRFSAAPVVVLPNVTVAATDSLGEEQRLSVAEQPGIAPALVTAVGRTGRIVTDRTFYAQLAGGPKDQVGHGWSAAEFGGYRLTAGRAPGADGEVVVGGGDRAAVGRKVRLMTGTGPLDVTVSGVTAQVPFEHAVFFSDAQAERISPAVDALVAYGPADQVRQAVGAAPAMVYSGTDRVMADPNRLSSISQLDGITTPLGLAAATAALVSVFVVAGTFALSVAQRRRELALLRLVGATRTQLRRLVCYEALLVGLLASAAGCALGVTAAPLLGNWLISHGMVPPDFSVPPTWWALAVATLTGLVTAGTGVVVSAVRAGLVGPLEALREATTEGGSRVGDTLRWVAGGLGLLGGSAVMVGIALLTPQYAANAGGSASLALWNSVVFVVLAGVLARPVVRLLTGRRGGGFVWRAARAGALGAARRTVATVTPAVITIGLAGCLLGTMDTINTAKVAAAHQQLSGSDFVVTPAGTPGLNRMVLDRIRAIPGTVVLTETPTTLITLQDGIALVPAPVAAVDPAALAAVSRTPVVAGSVADLGPDSVVLTQDWPGMARVGERIQVWLADGTPKSLKVAAVLSSTGGKATAYLSSKDQGRLPASVAYVRLTPGADRDRIAAALDRTLQGLGVRVNSPDQVAAAARDANQEQSRTGLELILGLALVYSGIALANTLAMTVADRRRELALLRLAGATKTQVVRIVMTETLMCVGAGVLIGGLASVFTVGGSWAALRRLVGPMPVGPLLANGPWTTLGGLAAICAVVALVAVALPTALALRTRALRLASARE